MGVMVQTRCIVFVLALGPLLDACKSASSPSPGRSSGGQGLKGGKEDQAEGDALKSPRSRSSAGESPPSGKEDTAEEPSRKKETATPNGGGEPSPAMRSAKKGPRGDCGEFHGVYQEYALKANFPLLPVCLHVRRWDADFPSTNGIEFFLYNSILTANSRLDGTGRDHGSLHVSLSRDLLEEGKPYQYKKGQMIPIEVSTDEDRYSDAASISFVLVKWPKKGGDTLVLQSISYRGNGHTTGTSFEFSGDLTVRMPDGPEDPSGFGTQYINSNQK